MTIENHINQNEIDLVKQANPEWSIQPSTMRIKRVFFEGPVLPYEIVEETNAAWQTARRIFQAPLVQVRAILRRSDLEVLNYSFLSYRENLEIRSARIIGEIPFSVDQEDYAIYYIQMESENRKSFTNGNGILHEEAVRLGFEKRASHEPRSIEGFTFRAIDFRNSIPIDLLNGERLNFNIDILAQEIVAVHKSAFSYPHDPAQQQASGIREILVNNPTVLAFDQEGNISSVGLMERDNRFNFGNTILVEPTYFTSPNAEGLGLSSYLRRVVKDLVKGGYKIRSYENRHIILFNESIRYSSFPLCLENGFELAGQEWNTLNGNLGDAYTAIGPASPERGYMPMGLTYLTSPELEVV